MAFHYKTQGIILKKRDAGETSRVFTVFSKEYGKLSLWAQSERNISSKLRGGLELFSLSQLSFIQGKSRKVVVEAVSLAQSLSLARDMERFQAAARAVHLLDRHTAQEQKDERVYYLLLDFLSSLKEGIPYKAYQSFAPQFLTLAGYGSESQSQ